MSAHETKPEANTKVDEPSAAPEEAPEAPLVFEEVPGRADAELAGLAGQAPAFQPRRRGGRGVLFWLALGWLAVIVFAAVTASYLPIDDPNEIQVVEKLARPGEDGHLLGADGLGRDMLSRIIFGARVSLIISVTSVTIGMIVGGTLGMLAGYLRGHFETLTMAVVDVFLAFPGLVLLLGLVAFVGQSLSAITIVIGFLSIPFYTRVARATTLAVSQREFVLAARAMGATHRRIVFREIMPNVILPVAAFGLVSLGLIIVLEGTLAFLNLSVQPPDATWGSMIAEGKRHLNTTTHVALFPSLAMFFTVLSINFVGDSLRSRFDVREAAI